MNEFSKIYLAWRKGKGTRRHIVGLLERTSDNNITFEYLPEASKLKYSDGFIPYFEFQDLNRKYDQNVLQIFSHRLMKPERPDIASFYSFWEVDSTKADDRFYLLGKTQGLMATDNFEFLADYESCYNSHFLTDIAGLSYANLPSGTLKHGDILNYEYEEDNPKDPKAILVKYGDLKIGYIKKIHSNIFTRCKSNTFDLVVKAIEQNGTIRKVFASVSLRE